MTLIVQNKILNKKGNKCENYLKIFIESFFIFMNTVSIAWIMVMFGLIMTAKKQQKVAIKSPTGFNRRVSVAAHHHHHHHTHFQSLSRAKITQGLRTILSKVIKEEHEPAENEEHLAKTEDAEQQTDTIKETKSGENENDHNPTTSSPYSQNDEDESSRVLFQIGSPALKNQNGDQKNPVSLNNSILNLGASGRDLHKFYFTYDYENGTGELYMRVGIAIFAMCSMTDRFLSLIQMV
jgi:hypothetical protein